MKACERRKGYTLKANGVEEALRQETACCMVSSLMEDMIDRTTQKSMAQEQEQQP